MRGELQKNGVQVEEDDGFYRLVPQGGQPVWMARHLDLVILGNEKTLVADSLGLIKGELEEDTLQASPDYQDLVLGRMEKFAERNSLEANTVEFKLDLVSLAQSMPAFANWPGKGEELAQETKLIGSFVSTKAMRALWGGIDFNDDSLSAVFSLDMNRNELSPSQERFYAQEAVPMEEWIRPRLRLIPNSAAAFMFLRVPVQLFLEEFVASLEKDARDIIDQGLREAGQRGGVRGLIENFARGLEPYVLVIVRNNDYPAYDIEYEVKIPSPAPAVAWVVEVKRSEQERVQKVLELLRTNHRRFGFQNKFEIRTGPENSVQIDEWPSTSIPATGQIAILDGGDKFQNMLMLSNSGKLLHECVNSYSSDTGVGPISNDDRLLDVVSGLPDTMQGSGFAWVKGEGVRAIADRYLQFALKAAKSNEPDPNFMIANRPAIERQIFDREFRSRARTKFELRGKAREDFEQRVTDVLRLKWQQEGQGRGQRVIAEFEDLRRYFDFFDDAYLLLRNDARKVEGELRLFVKYQD
jgi:hypothetical protein